MKLRPLLISILILTTLLTSCNTKQTISPITNLDLSTPTPEVFNPLSPSPTPSGNDLPLTCQVTDLKVYMNPVEGYCFAYPLHFREDEQPWVLGRTGIIGPAVGSSADPVYALLVVEVSALDPEKSFDQQADEFLTDFAVVDPNSLAREQVTVGGESALQVDAIPVQLSWRVIFVPHNGYLYRLMYWPVDVPEAQADLDELYHTTLNSFAFLVAEPVMTSIEMPTIQPPSFQGVVASYGPLSLVLPPGLASGGTGSQFSRVDGQEAAWWQLTPGHTQLILDDYYLQDKFRQAAIYIYPAHEYAVLQTVAAENIQKLQTIQDAPGVPIREEQLPVIPFYNEIPIFTSNIQVIPFQNGQGVRSLTQYGQSAAPANNNELFYQFQGLTSDGAYYVVAILPISAPGLGESSDPASANTINGVAYPTMGNPNTDWKGYYAAVTGLLNATPPKAFAPTLAQLDLLIQSVRMTP